MPFQVSNLSIAECDSSSWTAK